MSYNEQTFLTAIENSFIQYKLHGARSNKKLKPLHLFVADTLRQIWGSDAQIHFMGEGVKELAVQGKFYSKKIDISVSIDKKPVFCLGVKFVTSNYKQNANNYFEGMMGETANIQSTRIPYAHLIILRYQTPYYKKNNAVTPHKTEIINKKDLQKYLNLMSDSNQVHSPQMLGIKLVDIDEKSHSVVSTDVNSVFGDPFAQQLESVCSVANMFALIQAYKDSLPTTP
jgi:hypothetical protein